MRGGVKVRCVRGGEGEVCEGRVKVRCVRGGVKVRCVRRGEMISISLDNLRSEPLLEDLVWNLRTWPLELIEWSTFNSHRLDIRINPEQDR